MIHTSTSPDDDHGALVPDYTRGLRAYLTEGGEESLALAYELGRRAVASGLGVVEIALLHHSVTQVLAPTPSHEQQERSAQFMAESLSPFELTHRGFRESSERLAQVNQALAAKNRELERTAAELRATSAALREANEELEAFSHTVAHDLRSPLNAVVGFAELIEDFAPDDRTRSFAEQIAATGRDMSRLISSLLEFARRGREALHKLDVDVSALGQVVVRGLLARGGYARAAVEVEPHMRASADPALLEVVITNLLGNALKYSSKVEAPQVFFGRAGQRGGTTVFVVRDNGAGFDMKEAGKLFGVFRRLHSADAFEGHGVGLATVQRVVRRHGGSVWAEAEVGKGASFYFTLEPGRAGA